MSTLFDLVATDFDLDVEAEVSVPDQPRNGVTYAYIYMGPNNTHSHEMITE